MMWRHCLAVLFAVGMFANVLLPIAQENTPRSGFLAGYRVTVALASGTTLGDVNGDGVINSIDAYFALGFHAGIIPPPPGNFTPKADVNEDGFVNAIDATLILQFHAGLLPSLLPTAARMPLDNWAAEHSGLPPEPASGDTDCDGNTTSIDALLVLQFEAALLGGLPCPENTDVYADGQVDSIDAYYILLIDAGLCCLQLEGGGTL